MKNIPTYIRLDHFTEKGPWKNAKSLSYFIDRFKYDDWSDQKFTNFGSREHFYHFLLGYLIPLVFTQTRLQIKKFNVLDCGPTMNQILNETLTRLGYRYEIISPSKVKRPIFLPQWDRKRLNFNGLYQTVQQIKEIWKSYSCKEKKCETHSNLILKRSLPPKFYLEKNKAELSGYGQSRRNITNWDEVATFLKNSRIDFSFYEPGVHSLGCQIKVFESAKKIIGVRGAEWANTIWCNPGLKIRFIDPAPPASLIKALFNDLKIEHQTLVVEHAFSEERPEEAYSFFS